MAPTRFPIRLGRQRPSSRGRREREPGTWLGVKRSLLIREAVLAKAAGIHVFFPRAPDRETAWVPSGGEGRLGEGDGGGGRRVASIGEHLPPLNLAT